MSDFSPLDFLELGTELQRKKISSENVNHCRFKAWYGIDWNLMSVVWYLLYRSGWLQKQTTRKPNPVHLLWALSFLKGYRNKVQHAAEVGKQEKTFQKWAWLYVEGIASLVHRVVSSNYNLIIKPYNINLHTHILTFY